MESTRQKRVSKVILQDLAIYFQRNASLFAKGGMITVTTVRISPDLGSAKVYLSIFAVADKQAVVDAIKQRSWEVRKFLGTEVKDQLRRVPELLFFLDDSLDQIERIEDLLK